MTRYFWVMHGNDHGIEKEKTNEHIQTLLQGHSKFNHCQVLNPISVPFLEVLEADGSNVWHIWVWRRRRATLNGWIFQARVCPFGWPWCPWCPGQMNERGCEPLDPFISVHPWLNPRHANVWWVYNTETGDFGLSFLVSFLKLKNYEELTYAHGLCLLSLPFISLSRRIGWSWLAA